MSQMLKSSGAMGLAVIFSRILGFVREAIYAWFMGDGWVASAFALAFQIPNLFRRLLGEGALSAAFIPIFKEKEKKAGETEMWRSANAVISGLIAAAAVIIAIAVIGISIFLAVAPHTSFVLTGKAILMLQLLRLMFPYMLLVCLAAIFIGMLNARGHFFIPAMGTTILNIMMIAAVILLAPLMGPALPQQIFGVAIGVLIGGLAQAIYQQGALRREGFHYRWVQPWHDPTVREVVRKMIPGMMGVAAFQINVVVTNSMAFYVDEALVASFNYAVRLMELPQGVFGISIATYLLPTLSALAVDKKYPEFRSTLRQAIAYLILVNLIASLLLVVLAEPIVRLLFERGKFTDESTLRAAAALKFLAPGLILFSLTNIVARAFYALGDTQTPMKISVVCLVLNLIFALMLVWPYRQAGLGLANTLSAAFNLSLLLYALRRKMKHLDMDEISKTLWPLLAAAVAAGLAAYFGSRFWENSIGHAHLAQKLGSVFAPAMLAAIIYFGLTLFLKIPAALEILALVRNKSDKPKS
jgi:putative peptidoglycan lipid II flippase